MDNKKNRAANTTITRNTAEFSKGTDNIYETVAILSKRANQIAADQKRELHKKIEEFASSIDTMDEIFENREQIEIVRHYDELYFRNPAKDDQNMQRLEEMENETIAETATDKQ